MINLKCDRNFHSFDLNAFKMIKCAAICECDPEWYREPESKQSRVWQTAYHSVRFHHFLSHFEIYAGKSKSRHRIERSNIENVFEVLFACVNLDWRQKF